MTKIKKIFIASFIFLSLLILMNSSSFAAGFTPPPTSGETGLWHVQLQNRAYIYMRYDSRPTVNGDNNQIETNPLNHYTLSSNNKFLGSFNKSISNPNNLEYDTFTIIEKEKGGNEIPIFSSSLEILNVKAIQDGINRYSSYSFKNGMTEIYKFSSQTEKQIKMYWSKTESSTITSFNDLPKTDGNPLDKNDGEYGYLNTQIDAGNIVSFQIIYQDKIYNYSQVIENVEFLKNAKHGYYYTIEEERFYYILYTDEDIIRSNDGKVGNGWGGFSIWNLTTNQLSTINKLTVYTHITRESGHNAYAYFYTPTMVIDELISVSVGYKYRYKYFTGNTGDWQGGASLMEKDKKNIDMPSWENKLLVSSVAATLAATALTAITPVWPLVLVGGIVINVALGLLFKDNIITHGDINQIEKITPSANLMNEIKEAWGFIPNIAENTIQKLHLGKFNKFGASHAEFDSKSFTYTEIVARSNGKVYIFDENNIITIPPTFDTPPLTADDIVNKVVNSLKDFFSNIGKNIWTLLVGLAAFIVFIGGGFIVFTKYESKKLIFWLISCGLMVALMFFVGIF